MIGLAATLAIGLYDVPAPGVLGYGTAMTMIGATLAVLSFGLVVALFSARKALAAVESYSAWMAEETALHAEELAAAQADALALVQAAEERDHALIGVIQGHGQRLEHRFASKEKELEGQVTDLRRQDSQLADRIATDVGQLDTRVDAVQDGASKTKRTLEELEADRANLRDQVSKVMAEERDRKAEFEALAAEEIRLMGRVGRTEALARGKRDRGTQYYRISRPRATHRGPFGEVYAVREVEGLSAGRAQRLKEFGLATTEDLWRANPTFVAAVLRCDRDDVKRWQEEAELMAVHGIGRERAKILVDAGVTSIDKLRNQEPARLVRVMGRSGKDAAQSGMTEANIAKWIEDARKLQPGR